MKRAGICLWMMLKRMGKHPVYWVLLMLFPAAFFVVPRFNRAADAERILVGYVMEEERPEEMEAGPRETGDGQWEADVVLEKSVVFGESKDILSESKGRQEEGDALGEAEVWQETEDALGESEVWRESEDVLKESGIWKEEKKEPEEGKSGYRRQILKDVEYVLMECGESQSEEISGQEIKNGRDLFKYIKYTDLESLKGDIVTGEISCGVVFDEEFAEKLRQQDYHHCITLYLPEGMNVGGIVQEDVFQKVYRAYSALWYAELLEQYGYETRSEEVLQKFSEYQKEGKVFEVSYEVKGENGRMFREDLEKPGKEVPQNEMEMPVLQLRGILAFLTLLAACVGALDGSRDRKRNLGRGMTGAGSLDALTVGAPVLVSTALLAILMLLYNIRMTSVSYIGAEELADQVKAGGHIAFGGLMRMVIIPEIGSALLYGAILWLFAMFFSRVLPERVLTGIMPCFLLIVLLCCPVVLNLGESVPLIGFISEFFPITWYLVFWG